MGLRLPALGLLLLLVPSNAQDWKPTGKQDAAVKVHAWRKAGDATVVKWFNQQKVTFNKTYTCKEAEAKALSTFQINLARAALVNADPDKTYWMTPGKFADIDFDTFKGIYLMKVDPMKTAGRKLLAGKHFDQALIEEEEHAAHRQLLQTSSTVDWRAAGKVTAIRDQGQCGSCWAFASVSAVESALLITKNTSASTFKLDLSEQQLVSCAGSSYGNYGCQGGSSDGALIYFASKDVTSESRYGYTSGSSRSTGTCYPALATQKPAKEVRLAKGPVYVNQNSQQALMAAVKKQPVIIYFDVQDSFYNYGGGVYTCPPFSGQVNHAMVVVGYYWSGTTDGSYWLVRNSWGTWWGEDGYARVAMTGAGYGPCGMQAYPMTPPLAFSTVMEDAPLPSPEPTEPTTPPSPSEPETPQEEPSPDSEPSPTAPFAPSPPSPPKPSPKPSPRPEPSRSPSPKPKPSPAPSPRPKPSPAPSPRQSPRPSPRPEPSRSPSPRPKPSRSPSPRPKPSPAPSPRQSPKPSPRPEPSRSPSPRLKPSPVPSPRPKPSPAPSPRLSPKPRT